MMRRIRKQHRTATAIWAMRVHAVHCRQRAAAAPGGRHVRHLLLCAALVLGLASGLAGCTSTSSLFSSNEPPPPPPAPEDANPQLSQAPPPAAPSGPMSPAASAAAPPGAARSGELMECVTQSCKINCAANVKPQFRPKWCAQFKPPE